MKKFYQWADKLGAVLQGLSLICVAMLGVALLYFIQNWREYSHFKCCPVREY